MSIGVPNQNSLKLVFADCDGLHASVLVDKDGWDVRKRVLVLTGFAEDDPRNYTVAFFTGLFRNNRWEMHTSDMQNLTGLASSVKTAFELFLSNL